jgi:hypothetical protein
MSVSENSSNGDLLQKDSTHLKLVNILKEHLILFNKSQVPKIKIGKERALKEVHKDYMLQTGLDISEKQVKKKIQNMKNELKKKVDKKATGNKKIHLKDWEKLLLDLLDRERNPVFEKIPGKTIFLINKQINKKNRFLFSYQELYKSNVFSKKKLFDTGKNIFLGALTAGIELATSSALEVPQRTPYQDPPPLPKTPTAPKKIKFNETKETATLSNVELQRLVLLEQLELIRLQKQKENIILERLQNAARGGENLQEVLREDDLQYTAL